MDGNSPLFMITIWLPCLSSLTDQSHAPIATYVLLGRCMLVVHVRILYIYCMYNQVLQYCIDGSD